MHKVKNNIQQHIGAWLLLLLLAISLSATAQNALLFRAINDSLTSHENTEITEQNLHYSKSILDESFDFQLTPLAEGKFSIDFNNFQREAVSIKVYDIIGNTLYETKVRIRGNHSRQIDLSRLKTNFFIVEIKNSRFNKVKSIVAS